MYIVFGDNVSEELRKRHIVLELETIPVNGVEATAYCVVQAESVALGELADVDRLSKIHQHLIDNLKVQNYEQCLIAMDNLRGRFGGELDSFYQVITDRIKEEQQ